MSPHRSTFEPEQFIADLRMALAESAPEKAVREVIKRVVQEPAAILRALGEPTRAGITPLHRSPELTILNVVWAPRMTLMPHDHRMWGVIGVYAGREDNIFWRRIQDDPAGRIEAAGARALSLHDVFPMGRDIIHSVTNPIPRFTGAIHVYGGDFFEVPRSEWDPESLLERPYEVAHTLKTFEEANAMAMAMHMP